MINYNKVRNGSPLFTAEEIANAEAQCNVKSVNQTKTTEVKTMTNTNTNNSAPMVTSGFDSALQMAMMKGLNFDYNAGTINGRLVRNYGIIRTMSGKSIKAETLVTRNGLMSNVLKSTAGMSAAQAKGMIFQTLEQVLFVESIGYGNPKALSVLPTDVQTANANKAYVVMAKGGRLVPCGLDSKTVSRLMSQTAESVCPDKKVDKAVLIGDGAIAADVYRNGNTLSSVNPLSDATKGITRCNAGFAPKAESEDRVVSALVHEGNHTDFVKEGIAHQAIFVPGLAVLIQGMVAVNDTKSFDYFTNKNFERKFAIETIGDKIVSLECPDFLVNGSEVLVNGVVIYTHDAFTEVEVVDFTSKLDELGTVWSFSFEATMVANSKTNVKVRDFGSKGMTHRNGVTVNQSNDWDLLFTSESIKTSEALLTMYTQAHTGHRKSADGIVLDVDGNEVTSAQINAWYRANGQYFTVTTPVHASNVDSLKQATGDKVTFTASEVEGIVNATQTVFGIQAEYLVNIELSSADELAGFKRTDAVAKTLQTMLTA